MSFFSSMAALFSPHDAHRLGLLERRWQDLPETVRTENQAIGKTFVACGATHGVHEACNFGCTACYLGGKANQQKPLPFEQVAAQLEAMRAYLGPGGNVQITSGEVTLLPKEDLVRIIGKAKSLGLSPMVMTHGGVLCHDPDYLDALVTEGGLTKISIHVDTTQRGRRGYGRVDEEVALNPVRDAMAGMLRDSRKRTGKKLKAATTMTVNRDNLNQLPDVLTWFLQNLNAFRILSLQPQAKTGRTKSDSGVGAEDVWQVLEQWFGRELNPHPLQFGHSACNRVALFLVLETGQDSLILQAVAPDREEDARILRRYLKDFGGVIFNDRPLLEILAKFGGVVMRKPWWLFWGTNYVIRRSFRERKHWLKVLGALVRGRLRIRPCAIVVHAFMSEAELATEEGKARLEACMFKLPVGDRMVSMCEMNGTEIRQSTYEV